MSRANARSGIEDEYEEAKETARVYLEAVGVLGLDEDSTSEYRELETTIMRAAILGAFHFPNDPFAADAAYLGHRYLHRGSDSRILENLLEKDRTHPAYREALTIIVHEMRTMGVAVPERLQRWEREHERVTGRWRQEATRRYRIGLVVEAMATGSDVLVLCGENERTLRRLQVDLRAAREQLGGKSVRELYAGHASERPQDTERCYEVRNEDVFKSPNYIERILEILNGMNARPWRHWNGRNRALTASDLVQLTALPLSEGAGVHAIRTDIAVRKHFANLYATRNDATADNGFPYSICDAVSEVLREAGVPGLYESVRDAWIAYRRDGLPCDGQFLSSTRLAKKNQA